MPRITPEQLLQLQRYFAQGQIPSAPPPSMVSQDSMIPQTPPVAGDIMRRIQEAQMQKTALAGNAPPAGLSGMNGGGNPLQPVMNPGAMASMQGLQDLVKQRTAAPVGLSGTGSVPNASPPPPVPQTALSGGGHPFLGSALMGLGQGLMAYGQGGNVGGAFNQGLNQGLGFMQQQKENAWKQSLLDRESEQTQYEKSLRPLAELKTTSEIVKNLKGEKDMPYKIGQNVEFFQGGNKYSGEYRGTGANGENVYTNISKVPDKTAEKTSKDFMFVTDESGERRLVPIPGGAADIKHKEKQAAANATVIGSVEGFDRLAESAKEILSHPGLPRITGVVGAFPNIPGSHAADAQAKLATLKSQVGLGVLQAMRNASKTGGALGSVSDAEGKRLEENLAALDKAQSVEQMRESLMKIIKYTESAKNNVTGAYNAQYGEQGTQPEKQGGVKRYNPATGKIE